MPADFVLGVDLDGVCGDHAEAFRRVVAAERGIDPLALPEQTTWDFTEWDMDREEFERLHRVAILDHHMFATMPVISGAAETLWRLSDAGVWIRLITHRLYANWGHAVAVADTVEWLDRQGIPYRDLCFLGEKPQVEADAYIDDAPHNVTALRATGAEVLVFSQPYNLGIDGPRAAGWSEVESWVIDRMAASGRTVAAPIPLPSEPTERLHPNLDPP